MLISIVQVHALILYMIEKNMKFQQKKNLNHIVQDGYYIYLNLRRNNMRFNYFTDNILRNLYNRR